MSSSKSNEIKENKNFFYAGENHQSRSFVLHSMKNKLVDDKISSINKRQNGSNTDIGPARAAKKIFNNWCRDNNVTGCKNVPFSVLETTKGGKNYNKIYEFVGTREKVENPTVVKREIDGKVVEVKHEYNVKISRYCSDEKYE
jgi:hypothetical protein